MVSQMNQRMFEAVDSFKYTDGLIIDMRFTVWWMDKQFGKRHLEFYANEDIYTIDDAYRCCPN